MHSRPDDPDALLRRALRAQPIFADLKPAEQSALAGVLHRVATLAPGQSLPATGGRLTEPAPLRLLVGPHPAAVIHRAWDAWATDLPRPFKAPRAASAGPAASTTDTDQTDEDAPTAEVPAEPAANPARAAAAPEIPVSDWLQSHVAEGAVVGPGALLPTGAAAAHLSLAGVDGPAEIWQAEAGALEAMLRGLGWSSGRRSAFYAAVALSAAFEVSPDLRQSARRQRQGWIAAAELRTFDTDTLLLNPDQRAGACWVVVSGVALLQAVGGAAEVLEVGDVFGVAALADEGAAPPVHLMARAGCTLASLSPGAAARLRRRSGWFERFVDARAPVEAARARVLAALGRSPVLAAVPVHRLAALLQGARVLTWRVGLSAPALLTRSGGFGVVLSGELLRTRNRPGCGARRRPPQEILEVAGPDACAFFDESSTLRTLGAWRARVPGAVVYVTRARAEEVLGARLDLAARAHSAVADRRALAAPSAPEADVALFEHLGQPGDRDAAGAEPLRPLALAVAAAIAHDFAESVAVLALRPSSARDPASAAPPTPPKGRRTGAQAQADAGWSAVTAAGPARVRLQVVAVDTDPPRQLAAALTRLAGAWPAGERPPAQVLVVAEGGLDPAPLRPLCDRTVLVDATSQAGAPAVPPGLPMIFARFRPPGSALPSLDPPNTVRLPFALGDLSGGGATGERPGETGPGEATGGAAQARRARLSALGRAITGRRVGAALGGGGAWGYLHLAMLAHLGRAGVPVDLVSGASFGAVVGASFAAGGPAGLDRLLARQRGLAASVAAGFFSGAALQCFMEGLLVHADGRPLDLRETPVAFLPACTDLVTGSQTPVLTGTLGRGVRASGSLPPFFAATHRPGGILLDGALSANVPAQICENEGVDFVVASEVIPAFTVRAGREHAGLREVLRDLNPVRRVRDFALGMGTLVETASEMSATVARVVFSELARPRVLPLSLADAEGVIEAAVSDPAFWNTLRRVRDLWATMAAPRRVA